ncbi:MAG: hypothetical protein QOE93_2412, partial [Actinomycetota bacterium]|nr:hypothetical protein [Actinomycetota bacterium]
MTDTHTATDTGTSRWLLPPDRIPAAWFNVVPHL